MVNWSPDLGTVLANEEVTAEGRSDIGNYPVYRRPLRQWMLRITAYADRLLADLDAAGLAGADQDDAAELDRPQRRREISFPVAGTPAAEPAVIKVFTTRPDTLPGATYLVLAPEHPLAGSLAAATWPDGTPAAWRFADGPGRSGAGWSPAAAVHAYRERAATMGDRQRTGSRDKTGVFTGCYAINPATGGKIPVFIGRLRADGLRHRGHHGGPGARRA